MLKVHLVILSLVFIASSLFPFELSQKKQNEATAIIGEVINCEFQTAFKMIDSLRGVDFKDPLYPTLKLMTLGLRNLDFDRPIDTTLFMKTFHESNEAVERYRKTHNRDSYSLTLEGFIKASYASYRIYHGKYFSAIDEGTDAVDLLEEAIEIDTTNTDAYFFLGFYSYARGELRKKMWMLLFWYPGNRKAGKDMLEKCSQTAKISSIPSKMMLADIYRELKMYDEAKELIDGLLIKYPKSRFMMWARARLNSTLGKYSESAAAYGWLSDSYETVSFGEYNALVTRETQLEMLDKAGEKMLASKIAQETIDKKLGGSSKDTEKILKKIRRYIK